MFRARPNSEVLRRAYARAALLTAGAVVVALAIAVALADRAIMQGLEADLASEMAVLTSVAREEETGTLEALVRTLGRRQDVASSRIGLHGPDGTASGNLSRPPPGPGLWSADGFRHLTVDQDGRHLTLGHSMRARATLLRTLAVAGFLIVLLQLAATLYLATTTHRALTAQIDRMLGGIRRFAEGDADARIERIPGADDRFDDLSAAINRNLDRVEVLIRGLRDTGAAIAHDLRTPLSRASMAIQTARDRPGEAQAELSRAASEIEGMVDISEAILRLSRIETQSGTEGYARFDLADLMNDICETYGPVLEDAGGAMICEVPDGPAPVFADRRMLGQAVVNLIENAQRYGPADVAITLRLERADGAVRVTVRDTGSGVAPDVLDRIFEPHYRVDASRSDKGSGLGLALVRAVAERHGGRAGASLAGGGLAVTLEMPIQAAPEAT